MRYNKDLFELLNKYTTWAKFDWCLLTVSRDNKVMWAIDLEEDRTRAITYVINCMFDNGMLDECFTLEELETLYKCVPQRLRSEVKLYIDDTKKTLKKEL